MGSLSPAISPRLLLPATTSVRVSFHVMIRSGFPCPVDRPNVIRLFKRNQCVASAEKNSMPAAMDFSDPDWKDKYEQDFEKRFNIPHMTDFFPDAESYPSTFCLRMRTPVSEDFAQGYPSDEEWQGYIDTNDRVLLKVIRFSSPRSAGAECIDPDCTWVEQWIHRAGPREKIFFKPENVKAAIVTCGGLCPGLNDVIRHVMSTNRDREIVWPPMVVIMNTHHEHDGNGKWTGMGNQELLHIFGWYEPLKGFHSYGPGCHSGMGVLVFEPSAFGHFRGSQWDGGATNDFERAGFGRAEWNNPGGVQIDSRGFMMLYGYIATKPDIDIFNQHSQGKLKLKFEMVSFLENVVERFRQMDEDYKQLQIFKKEAEEFKMRSKRIEVEQEMEKLIKEYEERKVVLELDELKEFEDDWDDLMKKFEKKKDELKIRQRKVLLEEGERFNGELTQLLNN